jgi:hypothetical protein
MVSSQYQDQRDQYDQIEDILPAFWEWLRAQEVKWRTDADRKKIHLSRSAAVKDALRQRASVARRICLSLTLCFITLGGALAWQYSDDATQHIARNWALPLISLRSVLNANSPTSSDVAAEHASKSSEQALIAGSLQTASVNQVTSESPATRSSAELQQQLDSIENDIVAVRRIVDRLAARQEQMAQGITMLQFTEHNVIEGLSSLPQSTTGKFLQRQNVQRTVQSDGVVQSNPVHIRPRLAQTPLPLR